MITPVFLAVALSLISAICYATAAVVQERTAAGTANLRGALTRGSWWWSVVLNSTGALLHVGALRYGPLTLVQPLGALTLVAAVPLGALAAHHRTTATQWRGMVLTLVGLVALLTATASGNAPDTTLSATDVLVVGLTAAVVIAALIRFTSGRSTLGGLAFAAASGIASGTGSTLAQTLAVEPALSLGAALVVALTAAFAGGGLLLSQKAYSSGLGGPLALLTLINPVTASVIGITLLGERFQYGLIGVLLALAGAAVAAQGVVLLSRPQPPVPRHPRHRLRIAVPRRLL
jgi:drug/metabolite transporter (DMT)-like permease